MSLTFFVTLSLCCFYWGLRADHRSKRRPLYLTMYAAMGAATLVKGLVGLLLPGMIIAAFLIVADRRSVLKEMDVLLGGILCLLIVVPWYLLVQLRNPGYLRYFFWEEHFVRFLTSHFHRSQPWYYFLIVLAVGFLPWTVLLPQVVRQWWKSDPDELTVFLVLWTILPFLFFTFSNSKLPHYILPIYPPLAVLTGVTFVKSFSDESKKLRVVCLPFFAQALLVLCLVVGAIRPSMLPGDIGRYFSAMSGLLMILGIVILLETSILVIVHRGGYLRRPGYLFVFYCIGLVPIFLLIVQVIATVSVTRSASELARKLSGFIEPTDQLVLYDGQLEGLPFYLRTQQPIWIVWSGKKSEVLGSFYIAEARPRPTKSYGKILFTFEEFAEAWKESKQPLLVLIKEKNVRDLVKRDPTLPGKPLKVDDFVLVKNL
jgi:4-amino-4-deoxy-L-arabinose transferase-like glycosyltransferase